MKDEECHDFFEKLWLTDPHPTVDSVILNLGAILEHLDWSKFKHGNFSFQN